MPKTITLADLLDDATLFSLEHQMQLADVIGRYDWKLDLRRQQLDITVRRTSRLISCTRIHMLGSAAPGPRSWLWAWGDGDDGFDPPEPLIALAKEIRDFGAEHDIPEFTSAEIPFDALPGSPETPIQAATVFSVLAKAVTGRWTAFVGAAAGGTQLAFLVEHPDFELPPPEGARVISVIQQALMGDVPITDHWRALLSYAVRRQLKVVGFSPDRTRLALSGSDIKAAVSFDEQRRITGLTFSQPPPNVG
jgi:hypothetical protein